MKIYKLALIPGDGIGAEVTDATVQILKAASSGRFLFEITRFPWSCAYYREHGSMMPDDGITTLSTFDAIYLGAVGWPDTVPDSVVAAWTVAADTQGV